MRAAGALAAGALAASLTATAGWAAATPPPVTSRPLVVERAGTVRVALPAALHPAGAGFEVVGPDGARLPSRRVILDGAGAARRARVIDVAATGDAWWVVIDAGAAPPAHQGLHLPLALPGLVRVELESSPDRRDWTPIASAELFRLGAGADLRGSQLSYPATDARYLRLRWPAAALFPRLEEVQLDAVATAVEEVALPAGTCAADGPRRAVCDLAALGDRVVDSVAVTLPEGRAVGWRLRVAEGGHWRLLGEGSWAALGSAAPRRVPAGASQGPLRLELWGESTAPLPAQVTTRLLPQALELVAPAAGTYELRSAPGLRHATAAAADAGDQVSWVVPGPARDLGPPPPLRLPAGAALPKASFSRHWPVRVDAPAGAAVRLPLPAAVEAAARADLADLRLARQGRQVPYLLQETATPERTADWDRLSPRPGGEGVSAVELPLPEPARRRFTGELWLRVPPQPLRREVRLVRRGVSEGVGEAPPVASGWHTWRCEPLPPLPCELTLSPPAAGQGPIRVEVADGDNAPLAELSAELWRPRREVVFAWPGGTVALLAGSPRLQPPVYDLGTVAPDLLGQPARTARLGPAMEGGEGAPAHWPRWAVLASLGLAAAALLLLLARALPRMPESGTSSS